MYCPKCKRQVKDGAKFCPGCGTPLKKNAKTNRLFAQIAAVTAGGVVLILLVCGTMFWVSRHLRQDDPSSADIVEEETKKSASKDKGESGGTGRETDGQPEEGPEDNNRETAAVPEESEEAPETITGWQMAGGKWYYYDEQGNMLADTWVGNYYVGQDGVMLANTLTADGYWLDEDGLASEDRRIYGICVFCPQSHQIEGDKIVMTGVICDTGYAPQEYIDSLKVGDKVLEPDGEGWGTVVRIKTPEMKAVFDDYDPEADGGNTVSIENRQADWPEDYECGYALHSQYIVGYESGSMEVPVYRPIKENVLLTADGNTEFVPACGENGYCYGPGSLLEFVEMAEMRYEWYGSGGWYGCLEVELGGSHINQARDIVRNYVG